MGLMVYSYSKRLLFEYINCLPNKSNDVIHVETDSIYYRSSLNNTLQENIKNYKGNYPIKFGSELGNVKFEHNSDDVSYFIGKKCYNINYKNTSNSKFVLKGISK